jgi:ABC-type Fe3+ transport system permease subunit
LRNFFLKWVLSSVLGVFLLWLAFRGEDWGDFFTRLQRVDTGLLWAYAYLPVPIYGTVTILVVAFITRFLAYATETIGGRLVQIEKGQMFPEDVQALSRWI